MLGAIRIYTKHTAILLAAGLFLHLAALHSDEQNKPKRPRITGKTDGEGRTLKPAHGELTVNQAVDIIARRIEALGLADTRLKERIGALKSRRAAVLEHRRSHAADSRLAQR